MVDDLIVYLHSPDDVFLIPNAANCAEVVARLAAAAPPEVEVTDRHRDFAVLAVQGPSSDEVLTAAGFPAGHDYMSFVEVDHQGAAVTVCRTGYTGERGYELVVASEAATAVWDAVVAAGEAYGLRPAGLGARDTLRTEMGYPLHGQDISPTITPVQARLGWAVGWAKPAFFGDAALRNEKLAGPTRLLRGLRRRRAEASRGPAWSSATRDGREVGAVTSGTFSPTLKTGIALALVDSHLTVDDAVTVDIRTRREAFVVTKPPFVRTGRTRAVTGRRSRIAHLVMILVGLVILAYPFTLGAAPTRLPGRDHAAGRRLPQGGRVDAAELRAAAGHPSPGRSGDRRGRGGGRRPSGRPCW